MTFRLQTSLEMFQLDHTLRWILIAIDIVICLVRIKKGKIKLYFPFEIIHVVLKGVKVVRNNDDESKLFCFYQQIYRVSEKRKEPFLADLLDREIVEDVQKLILKSLLLIIKQIPRSRRWQIQKIMQFFFYLEHMREQMSKKEDVSGQNQSQKIKQGRNSGKQKSISETPIPLQDQDPNQNINQPMKHSINPISDQLGTKILKKTTLEEIQEEYLPEQKLKIKKGKTKQNFKRNIIPNIIHQLYSFIQKKPRSSQIVQRYYSNLNLQGSLVRYQVKKFYNYQKLFSERKNKYLNIKAIRFLDTYQEPSFEIYSKSEQDEFLMINRILIKHFLKSQLDLIIMTSMRMGSQSRQFYLQSKRKIKQAFEYLLQEQ